METINLKVNSDEALLLINALNLLDIGYASSFNQVYPSLTENEKVKAKAICIKYRKTIENLTNYITASKL